jgi:hypothetical protein
MRSGCTGHPLLGHTAPENKPELRFRSPRVVVPATLRREALEARRRDRDGKVYARANLP